MITAKAQRSQKKGKEASFLGAGAGKRFLRALCAFAVIHLLLASRVAEDVITAKNAKVAKQRAEPKTTDEASRIAKELVDYFALFAPSRCGD